MTCEDEAVRNKYYNLIDSFYHKSEGKILESISEDANGINLQFTDGNTATPNTFVVIPKLPGSQDISFISGLQEALNGKVSTSPGKGLSDQNFSLAEKQKLSSLKNYVKPNSEEISYINGLQDALDGKVAVEAGKGLSSNDFTDVLKQRLEAFSYNDLQNTLWEIGGNPFNLKVPTIAEWQQEYATWSSQDSTGAFNSILKLTKAGRRDGSNGSISRTADWSFYWSSTAYNIDAKETLIMTPAISTGTFDDSQGHSLRLIAEGEYTQQEFIDNYQNQTLTIDGLDYGFVYNSATQKVWLDRNLGAIQVATSATDTNAYGGLFQWGRDIDGHEKRDSTTTNILATTPQPDHGKFITGDFGEWLSYIDNTFLWQGITGVNNPASDTKLIGTNGLKASYKDLKDLPNLSTSATTGDYNDLLNKPDLSAFNDLVQEGTFNDFPATGDTSKLYIALYTGYTYRWDGNSYIQLTDQTAIWGQISGSITDQEDLQNELKKVTFTIDLTEVLSTEFSASQDLIISSMTDLGSPQQEILVNDVAYTFGDLINQFDKITVNVPFKTVINLYGTYE